MAFKYSNKLIENFENPKNIGGLKDYTVKGEGYNEKDGDWMEFYLLIDENIIKDIGYVVKGCPRAIASCSYTSQIVKSKKINDILKMDDIDIRKNLGLEDPKFRCVSIPLQTIQESLKAYLNNT
jgi:nitrogen fixation NifU-like protein